jgi:hypothetical protein
MHGVSTGLHGAQSTPMHTNTLQVARTGMWWCAVSPTGPSRMPPDGGMSAAANRVTNAGMSGEGTYKHSGQSSGNGRHVCDPRATRDDYATSILSNNRAWHSATPCSHVGHLVSRAIFCFDIVHRFRAAGSPATGEGRTLSKRTSSRNRGHCLPSPSAPAKAP